MTEGEQFQVAMRQACPMICPSVSRSARFEQQNGNLAEIKVNEMLRLVCDIAAKVASNNTMPCGIVLLVKLLLDVCSYVFFNVVLLQGLRGAVNSILLHVL